MTDKDDPARLASKSGTTSNLSLRFIFPHYASHPIVDCIYLGQGFLCTTRGQMTWNVIFVANYLCRYNVCLFPHIVGPSVANLANPVFTTRRLVQKNTPSCVFFWECLYVKAT